MEGFCQEKVNILKMWLVYSEIGLCKAKPVLLYASDSHFLGPHFESNAKAKANGLLTDVLNSKFPSDLEMICLLKKETLTEKRKKHMSFTHLFLSKIQL